MSSTSIKMLFVDDDPVTCSVMRRNCDKVGYDWRVFQSSVECLQAFEQEGADFVVTDLRMPEITGFELLSRIRETDPDVPVLVMTGYSSVENAVEAMKLGATDFIKKPFDFEELRIIVQRTIDSRKLRNENMLLKKRLGQERNRFGMIGDTPVMRELFGKVEKVADTLPELAVQGPA